MSVLAPSRTGDNNIRVEDYLEDKIQTVADLENVDDLIVKIKEQQELLKQQLVEARIALTGAEEASNQHGQALRDRAEVFQQDQADIDRRMRTITQSAVSDDAVKLFESQISKMRRLEIADGYVEILKEADALTKNARKNLKEDAKSAVASYAKLKSLLHGINIAQPAAEGAAPHLVDQVEQQASCLYSELKASLETSFQITLERMLWPKKELKLLESIVQDWTDQAASLLDLQAPELENNILDSTAVDPTKPAILLPLQVMIKPLAQRFQYHFYGERPTNRLNKPEYFFSHILDLIEQHSAFMNRLLQPILDEKMSTYQELEAVYPDAISAFITALLPMVSAKCLSLLPNISTQPQLLSHFMHEMMAFDGTLRDTWAYAPIPSPYIDWKGLTWQILNTYRYFNTWLEVEKEFALNRYKKIRDSAESGNIDFESVESGRSKPTKGAIRVNDLLETITDRYRGLTSFSQKMKFLMDIQLAIFDDYHSHLHGALQAYLVTSHTAGRLIQGQSEADSGGLKGLETLAKIFGSAEYLERKMSDWSEDLFFLELWEELQDRARRNTRGGSVGRDLTVEDVAARTSATIKQSDELVDDEAGALFDETAASYRRLRERSETEIVRSLEISIRNAIRPITKISAWSTLNSASSDIASLTTSSALDSLLSTLSSLLGFLAGVVAQAPLRRIARQLCLTLQRELLDNLIMRNTFSAGGATQLRRDVTAIEDVIDSNINMPDEAQRNMRKLEEALTMLNLPVRASTGRAAKIAQEVGGDDNWGFDDDDDEETNDRDENIAAVTATATATATNDNDDEASWGLWEAEKAIFASNESARQALADMRLEVLTESEARDLIRRRVEINS